MAPRALGALTRQPKSSVVLRTVLILTLLDAAPADATPTAIMPVEQIHPGQTGYGLTVFSGFKIERFKARVIAVMRNFLPKQDIILMRVDHPRLRQTNVVGGMSGSPIFIDGKLVGALAYGWRFSKEPITGITPIGNMLGLLKRKLRGPDKVAHQDWRRHRVDRLALASLSRRDRWWKAGLPRRPAAAAPGARDRSMLAPVSVPLNVAGISPETFVDVRRVFGRHGFEPVQGGGTGKAEGPTKFEPGAALGVQLASGDVSMTGTGTVTWVGDSGKDVLAFGHSAFNAGEIYLPAVSARINHTLANVARSFKLSSPARVLGALVQDRQPAIQVDTSRRVGTVPMTLVVRAQGQTHSYRVNIARHRLLTGSLATMVVSSALNEALADVDHASHAMQTSISLAGLPQLKINEHGYSPAGVRRMAVFSSRGLAALQMLLANEFRPVQIERIDLRLDVDLGSHAVEIVGLSVSSNFVDPGSRINLMVTYRSFGGSEFTKSYPLEIPASLAGSMVKVEVASGRLVQPVVAQPRNIRQMIRNLQTHYPGRSVVVSLYTPTRGLKIRGRVIRDLPESVIDSLNTASKVQEEAAFDAFYRQVHSTRRVITGRRKIHLRVKASESDSEVEE